MKSKLGFDLIANDVDTGAPLLYRILVHRGSDDEGQTIYVGRTLNGSGRPFRRYDLNLRHLIAGDPPVNGSAYRPVHHDLHAAYRVGHRITVELVRNVDLSAERINEAERQLQMKFGVAPIGNVERRMLQDDGTPVGDATQTAAGR